MEKALNVRLFAKSCDHPQWRSGYVRSGQPEDTGFKFSQGLSFSLPPFFFLFCFVLFAYLFYSFFVFVFFVFKYILK